MKHLVALPSGEEIQIRYDKTVYPPTHSMIDTILLAHQAIREGNGQIRKVLDVGCGTGVIGLSIKKLHPEVGVLLCDIDPRAVYFAKKNAKLLKLDVRVLLRDLSVAGGDWDLVVANLPTFDNDQIREEIIRGPLSSYYGGEDGLKLYEALLKFSRAPVMVCECQKKHQDKFLELVYRTGWECLLQTDFGFLLGKA